MKKLITSAAVVAMLAGFSTFVFTAWGQQAGKSQSKTSGPPKIALIDMAHIFKNYKKFEVLRNDLKSEIAQKDQEARQMAQQAKTLKDQLSSLKDGSPDYIKVENKIAELTSEFETFRKVAQKEFLRKESKVYKTIYMEVVDLVKQYADHYGYTLVLRFDRDDIGETQNPQQVLQNMNRLVVYHRGDDITIPVLNYLNDQYASSTKSGQSRTGRNPNPGQGTRR